jgi:thiol-disulfide isomerase/thioredoxin
MLIVRLLGPLVGLLFLGIALAACGARPAVYAPAPEAMAQPSASTAPAQPSASAAPARPSGKPAPELSGGGAWINSEPTSLAALRGKVVLVNFWTLGCINCKNTLPSVQGWWQRYKDQGLVIIGVHTPEFGYEAELENVRKATVDLGVSWPVVQDNDWKIWKAYKNSYWPRFYLIDKQGNIIYDHIGEGGYDETERQIQAALAAS